MTVYDKETKIIDKKNNCITLQIKSYKYRFTNE